jgi:phage gp45-like
MSDLVSILRAIVRDEMKLLQLDDLAVVTAGFPHADGDSNNYECNVKLRESGLELKKVPICTPHVGMVSTPKEGDLVLLSYVGGDANRPIVVARLYSDQCSPPVHEAGEWRVVSKTGGEAFIAIDKDESIVVSAGDTVVTVKKGDTVSIKGPKDLTIEVEGNVELKCADCKVDASGTIDLGAGGAGVITEKSHTCYFTGAPLVGSQTVKAKG